MRFFPRARPIASLLLLWALSPAPEPPGDPAETLAVSAWYNAEGHPRPAGDLLGDEWREDNGLERKRWLAGMHRVAPGTDWRAIERANAAAELERVKRGVRAPGRWVEVGSSNQAGHTRCVALQGEHLYVGSAGGGLWRGTPEGRNWEPVSDPLFGGVDEVVALEGRQGDHLFLRRGDEVFVSSDGGAEWGQAEGLAEMERLLRLVRFDSDPPRALLLGIDSTGRIALLEASAGEERFRPLWTGAAVLHADLWLVRRGAGRGREIWLAQEGTLLRSQDGGRSFQSMTTVEGAVSGVRLAGSEAGGPRLYLALRRGRQWRLLGSDAGGEFQELSQLDDFWGPLVAFSGDPEVVLVGGLEAHRSTDGGVSFHRLNTWGQYYADPARRLHADIRGMTSLPDPDHPDRDLCWISTDGGTYLSQDRGESLRNLCLRGLGVGQVYSTLSAAKDPDLILAGTQDQGYQRGRRQAARGRGPSTPFDQLLSGDYGYLVSQGKDQELVYASYPGFVLVQEGREDPELLYPWVDLPADAAYAWMPPLVADPTDGGSFYLLADHLYRYRRRQGPYWAYRVHSEKDFGAGGGHYLTAMAFVPGHPEHALAGDDTGALWYSLDGAVTWRRGRAEGSDYLRPTTLAAHPTDPLRAVAGGAGYSGAAVWVTRDGGRSWRPLGEGLPRTLVYDLVWSPGGDLYAATEAGAWWLPRGRRRWSNLMGSSAPRVAYWSAEWVGAAERVRFGTYGRGIWDFIPARPEGR